LPIYPETANLSTPQPPRFSTILDGISSYKILKDGKVIKGFKDTLSSTQKIILNLLEIDEDEYRGVAAADM